MRWSDPAMKICTALVVSLAVAVSMYPIRSVGANTSGSSGSVAAKESKPVNPPEAPKYPPNVRKCNSWIKVKQKGNVTIYMIHTSCKKWWGWSRPTIFIRFWSNGQQQTVTPKPDVDADGTANAMVSLDSTQVTPGQTITVTLQAWEADGTQYTETVELQVPRKEENLPAKAASLEGGAKYRTSVAISFDDVSTAVTSCPGPFMFRIQKQQVTTISQKAGKPVEEVTWTTLPAKYETTEAYGPWHQGTVKLEKGTYRSVIYGKCGLLGSTTDPVTIK